MRNFIQNVPAIFWRFPYRWWVPLLRHECYHLYWKYRSMWGH